MTVDTTLIELENTNKLCQMLMQSPHYKKIGPDGIFAIVETAKSLGVDPRLALNGGMYFVRGKVEMSAMMMNTLIRQAGHSITKDKKSDDNVCILHGKRADTGDTWCESFSIEDAQKAQLTKNPTWRAYQKDMLFARALSRLARQLFPDVVKGCYVQGEIAMDTVIHPGETNVIEFLGAERALELQNQLRSVPDYEKEVVSYLDRQGLQLENLEMEAANKIRARIESLLEEPNE